MLYLVVDPKILHTISSVVIVPLSISCGSQISWS